MSFVKTTLDIISKKSFKIRNYSSRNMMRLKNRGMVQEIFPANAAKVIGDMCNSKTQCVYAGFDPTASSLHIGHLVVLTNLLEWHRAGHDVIILIGGATGRIGDPSGRSKDREVLQENIVSKNTHSITSIVQRLFDNASEYHPAQSKITPIRILNNNAWFSKMDAVEFACGVGRNFRMGTMMSRTSVSSKLNSEIGMSFTEFTYQIFQAYDWLHLFKNYNCRFQIGGNDQMGNIMSGQELISRISNTQVYGLTVPLITTEGGDKYGKSCNNAVWLDSELTSVFDFYQFLIRTPDSLVHKLLSLFTFLDMKRIDEINNQHKRHPEKRIAQGVLAEEVTRLVHRDEGLVLAKRATAALYHSDIDSLAQLDDKSLKTVLVGAEHRKLPLQPGITVKQLALSAACFPDNKDADRIIAAGGFYINNKRASNPDEILVRGVHILSNNISLLRVGQSYTKLSNDIFSNLLQLFLGPDVTMSMLPTTSY